MPGINKQLIAQIEARLDKGKQEYKQEVQLVDDRDFVQEALEEALDLSVYLSAELIRIKELRRKISSLDNENTK